jgi:hypothetical protein
MRIKSAFRGAGAVLLLFVGPASAQAPAPSQDRPAIAGHEGCAPGEQLRPGATSPKMPETTGENLSDKLARNDGVLCPPDVDPAIKAPTPETGKMPVIPPPGSPGGNPNVQPK